jgi:hypothetical protein
MSSQESPGVTLRENTARHNQPQQYAASALARHGLIGDDKHGNLMGVWGVNRERGLVPRFCASKCS